MERVHFKIRDYQNQIKQRSPMHSMLVNVELQTKNKAPEEEPRP